MIDLTFCVRNPRFIEWRDYATIRTWCGQLVLKNKYWEVEVLRSGSLVEVDLKTRMHCDHAGITLVLGLLNYSVRFSAYDNRRWDYEANAFLCK